MKFLLFFAIDVCFIVWIRSIVGVDHPHVERITIAAIIWNFVGYIQGQHWSGNE